MSARVLLIEDDADIARLVEMHLRELGFRVTIAANGKIGVDEAQSGGYSLVILDIMIPEFEGFEVCKTIRKVDVDLPILMLTSKSEEVDKVVGLEIGADDFVTKPFSVRELVARVKALLRRSEQRKPQSKKDGQLIEIGRLQIDPLKRKAKLRENLVVLTQKEFDLLLFLAASPGRPYTREELLTYVWEYEFEGYQQTVTSHINRLRLKIEEDPSEPVYIRTVWGVGYRFAEKEEVAEKINTL